jgi:ABC-type multidrug transport system ATPase subunit
MGPSGSGKSTFLSILSGTSRGRTHGRLLVNGRDAALQDFSDIVGFVPQDDVMLRMLNVEELLMHNAAMFLDRAKSQSQICSHVESVIELLELNSIRHTKIGDEELRGISGGQRKRANIGMEMVANPTVLLLDEPTSGLDSTSSREVCVALQGMAKAGMTVVTSLHQPSWEVFETFNNVLFLSKVGQPVYFGPAGSQAIDYFQRAVGQICPANRNPVDFIMDMIALDSSTGTSHELTEKWETFESNHPQEDEQQRSEVYIPRKRVGMIRQTRLWFQRGNLQHVKRLREIVFEGVFFTIAGIYLGVLFYFQVPYVGPRALHDVLQCRDPVICTHPEQDTLMQISSLVVLALSILSTAVSLDEFGDEKAQFRRERFSGANLLPYLIGKDLARMKLVVSYSLFFMLPFYAILGNVLLSPGFSCLWIVGFLTMFCVTGIAYWISIFVAGGYSKLFALLYVFINFGFSGSSPSLQQFYAMPIFLFQYAPYFSYARWGQEAFYLALVRQWEYLYFTTQQLDLTEVMESNYAYDKGRGPACLWVLFAFGIVYRLLACLCLLADGNLMAGAKRRLGRVLTRVANILSTGKNRRGVAYANIEMHDMRCCVM